MTVELTIWRNEEPKSVSVEIGPAGKVGVVTVDNFGSDQDGKDWELTEDERWEAARKWPHKLCNSAMLPLVGEDYPRKERWDFDSEDYFLPPEKLHPGQGNQK